MRRPGDLGAAWHPVRPNRRQDVRAALDGCPLHVVHHTAHTAHFFTTARTTRTAMGQVGQGRAVACALCHAVAVVEV